jgi:signal transduction histidine kinase
MALLQIGLGQFERDVPGLSPKARIQLHSLTEVATEIASSIHNLSHRLRPSLLDLLGPVASIERLCRELSDKHNLEIRFVHHSIPEQTPKDVTLCLYRITQEALRNVVKHSGVAEAEVELLGHDDRIDLCISDSGAGFNPESAQRTSGLGLISMQERLRLVGGHLSVESEPSHGTRIRVRIPRRTVNAEVDTRG